MARLFYTGFETGDVEWNGGNSTISITGLVFNSSVRRTGTYSLEYTGVSNVGNTGFFRHIFEADKTELFGRMAVRFNSAAAQADTRILRFLDANGNTQMTVLYNSGTFGLDIYDGGGTRQAVGNVIVPAETWVVIEWNLVIATSGSLTIKINGTTSTTWAGDTDYTNYGSVRSVRWEGTTLATSGGGGARFYMDDVAVNDAEGSYEASWPGLGGVFYLEPTADGAQNDWTPSAGSDNYAMVDDIPPDNATTFNQALDSGDIDLYEVDDCPDYIAEINCLQVAYRAALVTSGYNELTDLVRVGTVNYSGTEYTVVPITPAFAYYLGTIHYLNPGTGTIWGTVEVNAMQAGVEITT